MRVTICALLVGIIRLCLRVYVRLAAHEAVPATPAMLLKKELTCLHNVHSTYTNVRHCHWNKGLPFTTKYCA